MVTPISQLHGWIDICWYTLPLFFVIRSGKGEDLSEVKEQIKNKLQIPDEEFSKWKFAFPSLGHPEYLQDADIVSHCF